MKLPRLIAAASLASLAGLCSCAGIGSEGGPLMSLDSFTYVSTAWQPKTISLYDTRTGESLWSVDIPVGKQLWVGFRKGVGNNEYRPDEMSWDITWEGRQLGSRGNKMSVPPESARRLEMTLRAAPEMPKSELPGSPYATTDGPKKGAEADKAAKPADKGESSTKAVPPVVPVEPPKPAAAPAPAEAPKAAEPAPAKPAEAAPAEPKKEQPLDLPG